MSKNTASTGTLPPAGSGKPPVTPATSDPQIEKIMKQMEEMKAALDAQAVAQKKKEAELDAREAKLNTPSAEIRAQVAIAHKTKAKKMRDQLHAQPKVTIMVPLEPGEAYGSTIPVTLNGYRYTIRKNVYVSVPEQVAKVIMESLKQTNAAGHDFRTDIARPSKGGITVEEALL